MAYEVIGNNTDIEIFQNICPTFHIQTDWLYEWIKLECDSNINTSYELKVPVNCERFSQFHAAETYKRTNL